MKKTQIQLFFLNKINHGEIGVDGGNDIEGGGFGIETLGFVFPLAIFFLIGFLLPGKGLPP